MPVQAMRPPNAARRSTTGQEDSHTQSPTMMGRIKIQVAILVHGGRSAKRLHSMSSHSRFAPRAHANPIQSTTKTTIAYKLMTRGKVTFQKNDSRIAVCQSFEAANGRGVDQFRRLELRESERTATRAERTWLGSKSTGGGGRLQVPDVTSGWVRDGPLAMFTRPSLMWSAGGIPRCTWSYPSRQKSRRISCVAAGQRPRRRRQHRPHQCLRVSGEAASLSALTSKTMT